MTLYIAEYPEGATVGTEQLPFGGLPPVTCQEVAPGAASAALSAETSLIRVVSDAACLIAIGAAPTAATGIYLPANVPEYFAVVPTSVIYVGAA